MNGNRLIYWALGALLTLSLSLSAVNIGMMTARLDRIEARQERALDDRRAIENRVTELNRQLSERLSRIEGKIDNGGTKK